MSPPRRRLRPSSSRRRTPSRRRTLPARPQRLAIAVEVGANSPWLCSLMVPNRRLVPVFATTAFHSCAHFFGESVGVGNAVGQTAFSRRRAALWLSIDGWKPPRKPSRCMDQPVCLAAGPRLMALLLPWDEPYRTLADALRQRATGETPHRGAFDPLKQGGECCVIAPSTSERSHASPVFKRVSAARVRCVRCLQCIGRLRSTPADNDLAALTN